MQRERGELTDDGHDDACRLTAARAAAGVVEQEPGLWHDLARRWLHLRRPERHAAWDEAGLCVSALGVTLA